MPTIPVLTAQQGPGILRLPEIRRTPGWEEVSQFGENLQKVGNALQKQQDDLDLLQRKGAYDNGLADAQMNLKQEPDYMAHEQIFVQKARDLSVAVRKQFPGSPAVDRAFTLYEQRAFPTELRKVKVSALELLGKDQLGRVDDELASLSTKAAVASTPEARDALIQLSNTVISRTQDNGLWNGEVAAQKKRVFQEQMLEKNMSYLVRTDRTKLRELYQQGAYSEMDQNKALGFLQQARQQDEHEQAQAEKALTEAKSAVLRDAYAGVTLNTFTDAMIKNALENKDPFISPQEAIHLQHYKDNPIGGAGSDQLKALMLEYHLASSSPERVKQYQKQLDGLRQQFGYSKALDAAANELQTDGRTERSIAAAEQTAQIKIAEDKYKSQAKPTMPGIIGRMQKNTSVVEQAELRLRMKRGEKMDDILKDIADRHKRQLEQTPPITKDLQELGR